MIEKRYISSKKLLYMKNNKIMVIFCYTKMINSKTKLVKSKGVIVGIEYD